MRQVAETDANAGMIRAEALLVDCKRAALEVLGLLVPTKTFLDQDGQVVES